MSDKEERRDRDGRRGDRSKRPDRNQKSKPGATAQGEKPRQERKPSGGPRIEARQDRGGAESKDRPVQKSGKRQDPKQQPAAAGQSQQRGGNKHRKAHTNQPVQAIQPRGKTIIKPRQPEVVPNSFFGIIKKIFAIIFGRKK